MRFSLQRLYNGLYDPGSSAKTLNVFYSFFFYVATHTLIQVTINGGTQGAHPFATGADNFADTSISHWASFTGRKSNLSDLTEDISFGEIFSGFFLGRLWLLCVWVWNPIFASVLIYAIYKRGLKYVFLWSIMKPLNLHGIFRLVLLELLLPLSLLGRDKAPVVFPDFRFTRRPLWFEFTLSNKPDSLSVWEFVNSLWLCGEFAPFSANMLTKSVDWAYIRSLSARFTKCPELWPESLMVNTPLASFLRRSNDVPGIIISGVRRRNRARECSKFFFSSFHVYLGE